MRTKTLLRISSQSRAQLGLTKNRQTHSYIIQTYISFWVCMCSQCALMRTQKHWDCLEKSKKNFYRNSIDAFCLHLCICEYLCSRLCVCVYKYVCECSNKATILDRSLYCILASFGKKWNWSITNVKRFDCNHFIFWTQINNNHMRQSSENTFQWNKRHLGGFGFFYFCFSLNTFVQILSLTRFDCVQFCVAYFQAALWNCFD